MVALNGMPVPFLGYQDNVVLPINDQANANVTIIFPFDEPFLLGKFVFHCHILAHEDNGMMAIIEVANSCPPLKTKNAHWALGFVGQEAVGNCVSPLVGHPTRLCLSDGTWSSETGTPCGSPLFALSKQKPTLTLSL